MSHGTTGRWPEPPRLRLYERNALRMLYTHLERQTLERVLRRTWVLGLGDVPPGVVPYLVHPWVVANDALKAHGWQPRHTNEEAILEGVDALGPPSRKGRRAVAGVVAGATIVAVAASRWGRRRPEATSRT